MQDDSEQTTWLQYNHAAILKRLQPIRSRPDGALLVLPAGVHFVVVSKTGSTLRLLLVEQTRPESGVVQSELDLEEPLRLTEGYTQAMMLGLLWNQNPGRIYLAGLGGGRLALLLHHYLPQALLDCTDIDPAVVDVACRFFGLAPDNRLHVAIQDGRQWLAEHLVRYDILLVDVFLDNGYSPYWLTTVEFYRLCQTRMTLVGVLIVNILAADPFCADKLETIQSVFDYVYICALEEDNVVVFASQNPLPDPQTRLEQATMLAAAHDFAFAFSERASTLSRDIDSFCSDHPDAAPLWDAHPPPHYFDSLPSFNSPFSRVDPTVPCPCGSGLLFKDCHGRRPLATA